MGPLNVPLQTYHLLPLPFSFFYAPLSLRSGCPSPPVTETPVGLC